MPELSFPSPVASLSLFHNIVTCPPSSSLSPGFLFHFLRHCHMPTFPFPLPRHLFPFFTTLSHTHLSLPSPLAFLYLYHNNVSCPPFPLLSLLLLFRPRVMKVCTSVHVRRKHPIECQLSANKKGMLRITKKS
jgi:hypothetical protein